MKMTSKQINKIWDKAIHKDVYYLGKYKVVKNFIKNTELNLDVVVLSFAMKEYIAYIDNDKFVIELDYIFGLGGKRKNKTKIDKIINKTSDKTWIKSLITTLEK